MDNSFDSVRNVYPLAWWILIEDPVAESEDGPGELPDHYEKAVEHGWEVLARVLDDPHEPRVNARIGCTGSPYCEGLREVGAKLVDAHPRLQTIPDEVAAGSGGMGNPEALMEALDLDDLLLVDIDVRDEVELPRSAVRIDLSATLLPSLSPMAVSTGIGVDHVPSRQLDIFFGLALLLTGLVAGRDRWMKRPDALKGGREFLRALLVGTAVGGVYGWFATSWAPFVPPMDAVALTPGGFLRLETFVWPLAVGALLLLGPPIVVSIGLVVVARRFPQLTSHLQLTGLVPGAQAGALTIALAPVCEGLPCSRAFARWRRSIPSCSSSTTSSGRTRAPSASSSTWCASFANPNPA